DGLYGNGLKTAIINFQQFVGLTADGYAGSQTWASLLVSTGDPDRKGTACDCSTTITAEKAATLKANGYEIVGRYLTGIYAMTRDELETIFANNLKVVPIFEVGGYNLIYFTSSQGASDANSAIAAANTLGFPDGTIIYFTVDFDALDIDVTNAIIPYFKAIKNTFTELGSNYKIGIYAPRNVCSRIANAGYSCSSFVCDMSSGFSGNLGYVLPQDWAFDQIRTVSIGSGSGHIEIDNDISSGKDSGVNCFIPIEALVNLANGILKVFKLSVTDLNVEQTISTGGIVVKWESGFKSDIGSGDVEFSVKNGQIEDFEAVANAISGSVGLSKNWFNDLGAAIKNGTIKISVKSNLSIEIEIDQEVPDDITITYPYLYTIIDISINDYINGLGSDVLNAVESAAPKVFAVAALVIAVCVIVELAPEVAVVALLSALTSVI
ncbi:glycoside hydrolase domain-containing protein, partial [Clostridium tyrobutyricum]